MSRQGKSRLAGLVLWGVVALICILAGGALALLARRSEPPAEAVEEKAVAVRALTIERSLLPDELIIPGRVAAFTDVTLSAEKPGRIVRLGADKGDRVEAGQELLRVDDRLWTAALRQAEMELRDAARDHARWSELARSGAVSSNEYEAVRRRLELAEIAQAIAKVNIEHCAVASPVRGVVDDRRVEQGEWVGEGAAAFRVVELDRVKVAVDVPEREVLAVRTGQTVRFTASVAPGQVFTGVVQFVAAAARPENNSFPVELVADNPGWPLRPGMIADVALVRHAGAEVLAVPLAAVIPSKGQQIVFVVEGGRAVRRTVQLERLTASDAVIGAGLSAGERVVVEGHRVLKDGLRVEVRE